MEFHLEKIKADFENCYIDFEKKIETFKSENPHVINRIKTILTESLHYTSDEEYFKFRRELNSNLSNLFVRYYNNTDLTNYTLYEIERYGEVLRGLEKVYFEKGISKENEISEFSKLNISN